MYSHTSRIGVIGLAVSVLLGSGGIAEAGLLSANSGGAIPAFTGTQFFDDNFFGFTVSANVDFAVFSPGTFAAAFPGQDPSGGADFVYAYQIQNLDTDVTQMTVGLDGDEPLGSIGFVAGPGLVDPTATSFATPLPSTSARFDFTAPGAIPNGSSSAVLFFTSSAAPHLDSATVAAGWSNMHDLPSPLPEPATLGLVLAGAGMMIVGKRRRM